jgi:exodeoxyribonuclease V alpha subunit
MSLRTPLPAQLRRSQLQQEELAAGEISDRTVTLEIEVTSFHRSPLGGGIMIGRDQRPEPAQGLIRVVMNSQMSVREPVSGEAWRVSGRERVHQDFGMQIHASVALPLIPTGRAIVRYLATSKKFTGVGWKTANRLWDQMGESLYTVIRQRDYAALTPVVGMECAVMIVQEFGLLADEVDVFQWLDRYGVSARTAAAVASIWGRGAIEKISADPYTLVLLEPWRAVDERALRLGLQPDDPRRLLAGVEEAFARRYQRGHTAAHRGDIETQLRPILGIRTVRQASDAVDRALEAGQIIQCQNGLLQSRSAWFMEREVERAFRERLSRESIAPPPAEIAAAIAEMEARDGYHLTLGQREAVYMAVSSSLSCICGGAGTGKTTVVKAILDASERCSKALRADQRKDWQYPQVALAGRAVKRIAEATGREAMTVARFLRQLEIGRKFHYGLLIFDESSMLDLPSVYRIISMVPATVDILFIGDPAQLPPIGPGLLFQKMVGCDLIPRVSLDVIHRQADVTGIPRIARDIREGHLPQLPRFNPIEPLAPGVYLAASQIGDEGRTALGVYQAMAGSPPPPLQIQRLHDLDIQILCPTKEGPSGIKQLNGAIENHYMARQPKIQDNWGLSIGSKILWLKNNYKKGPLLDQGGNPIKDRDDNIIYHGFMNGALGIVRRQTDNGCFIELDDGAADEVRAFELEHLSLGWAISVHKAQGSAFRRVIVPLTSSRVLDRALIYTAVTRAIDTVVLVGDMALIKSVIAAAPKVSGRVDGLQLDTLDDPG